MRGVFAAAFAVSIVTAAHDARADTYCSFARCTYLSRPPSFMGFDVGFVWTRFANTTTANAAPFTGQAFRADWRTMTRHRVVFGAEFDWGHVGGGAQQPDGAAARTTEPTMTAATTGSFVAAKVVAGIGPRPGRVSVAGGVA